MSDRPGLLTSVVDIGKSLATTLPPAFVLLLVLNFLFLYVVLNTMEHQNDQRLSILNAVISKCLGQ
jgi:hypothetical protein